MATRADLRLRVLRDLERDEAQWGADIDASISDAIRTYQPKRFYFNEFRTLTFNTVAGTDLYTYNTPTLTGTIGAEFYRVDETLIREGGKNTMTLQRVEYDWLEGLADDNQSTGMPYNYAYINRGIRIYPMPNKAYEIRILGHMKVPEPADDLVNDNPWMNEAFQLVRAGAKLSFAINIVEDEALAARMALAEQRALSTLRSETHAKIGSGNIIPTSW